MGDAEFGRVVGVSAVADGEEADHLKAASSGCRRLVRRRNFRRARAFARSGRRRGVRGTCRRARASRSLGVGSRRGRRRRRFGGGCAASSAIPGGRRRSSRRLRVCRLTTRSSRRRCCRRRGRRGCRRRCTGGRRPHTPRECLRDWPRVPSPTAPCRCPCRTRGACGPTMFR